MQNSVKMLGALIGCIWTLHDHVLTSGEPQNARDHPPSWFDGSRDDSGPNLNQYEPFQHSKRLVKHSKWFAGHGSDDSAVPSLLTCSSIAGLTSTAFRGPASVFTGRFGSQIIVFHRISGVSHQFWPWKFMVWVFCDPLRFVSVFSWRFWSHSWR